MTGRTLWFTANIDQRAAIRFGCTCAATVTAGSRSEQGTVVNLSVWGCAVRSRIAVARGERVSLTLAFADDSLPLVIELSRVRWCRAGLLGIEFLNMAGSARARLRRRLLALRGERISVGGSRVDLRSERWARERGRGRLD